MAPPWVTTATSLIGMTLPKRPQSADDSRRERRKRFTPSACDVLPRGDSPPLLFETHSDLIAAEPRP